MTYSAQTEGSKFDWSVTFARWSTPPSDTEEQKAERAARMIREALKEYEPLARRNVEVYPTGSFHNNTNVRSESDIDVAAVCHDSIFYDVPAGWTAATAGISTPASYSFNQFRDDVQAALQRKFGTGMKP